MSYLDRLLEKFGKDYVTKALFKGGVILAGCMLIAVKDTGFDLYHLEADFMREKYDFIAETGVDSLENLDCGMMADLKSSCMYLQYKYRNMSTAFTLFGRIFQMLSFLTFILFLLSLFSFLLRPTVAKP